MKVADVYVSEDGREAVITLLPNWVARLFGARALKVYLVKRPNSVTRDVWYSAHTGRGLTELEYGRMMRTALEAQPQGRRYQHGLPRARVIT